MQLTMGSLKTNHRPSISNNPPIQLDGSSRDQPIPFGLEQSISGLDRQALVNNTADIHNNIPATEVDGSDAKNQK